MLNLEKIVNSESKNKLKIKRRFKKIFYSALAFGLILFSLYKATHFKCDPNYSGPKKRDGILLKYYDYPKQTIDAKVEKIDETKEYVLKRVEFPSTINVLRADNNILIDYYENKKDGEFPTILILPIAGGIDFSVKSFANYFASNCFNCAVVHNKKIDPSRDSEYVENFLKQAIIENRQVLDYLVQQEKVDENKMGSLGISLGGINAAITAGVDERLKCNVIIIAGGSVADILCYSNDEMLKKPREDIIDRRKINLEQLHTELSEKIKSDPLRLAHYTDARNILMYVALFDRTVPRRCGTELWNAIGKPELIYTLTGHYSSVLYLPYAKRKSLNFFRKKFDMK